MKMMKPVLLTASLTALCLLPLANAGAAPKRLAFDVPDPDVKTWDVGTPIGQGRNTSGAIINTLKYKVTAGTFSKENDPYIAVLPQGEADFHIDPLIQDFDHWQLGGASGDEADQVLEPPANLNYTWTATGGAFVGATSTHDAKWTAPTQDGLYEVTCTVDDKPLQPGVGETGTRDDEPLKLKFTVAVTHFSVALKVLQVKRATATTPESVGELTTGEITAGKKHGGLCEAALELDMGPALHYVYPTGQPAPGGGFSGSDYRLRVEETTGHADNESAAEWILTKSSGAGTWDKEVAGDWQKITDYYFDRLPRNTTEAMKWRVRHRWNTATRLNDVSLKLQGHNGAHKLSAIRSDSLGSLLSASRTGFEHTVEVVFPDGHRNGQKLTATPTDKTFDIHNVVFTEVKASAPNIGNPNATSPHYFKFDNNSTEDILKNPTVTFTIEDKGEQRRYHWYLWVRATTQQGFTNFATYEGQIDQLTNDKATRTVTINQASADYTKSGNLTDWGTYAFDMRVVEITPANVTDDKDDLRSWLISIPQDMPAPIVDEEGHSVPGHNVEGWAEALDEESEPGPFKYYASYYLDSERDASKMEVDFINSDLQNIAALPTPPLTKKTNLHDLLLYTPDGHEPPGTYKGVFVPTDDFAMEYRDHKAKAMLAVNTAPGLGLAALFAGPKIDVPNNFSGEAVNEAHSKLFSKMSLYRTENGYCSLPSWGESNPPSLIGSNKFSPEDIAHWMPKSKITYFAGHGYTEFSATRPAPPPAGDGGGINCFSSGTYQTDADGNDIFYSSNHFDAATNQGYGKMPASALFAGDIDPAWVITPHHGDNRRRHVVWLDLSDVNLVFYHCCDGARPNTDGSVGRRFGNLAEITVDRSKSQMADVRSHLDRGAKRSVGWKSAIIANEIGNHSKYIWQSLLQGNTLIKALQDGSAPFEDDYHFFNYWNFETYPSSAEQYRPFSKIVKGSGKVVYKVNQE